MPYHASCSRLDTCGKKIMMAYGIHAEVYQEPPRAINVIIVVSYQRET